MEAIEVVDLAFPVQGRDVPADHGYLLYATIAREAPAVHGDGAIGIHPLRGRLAGERRLALERSSRLVIRLPVDRIPALLPLAGRRLDLAGSAVTVGVPAVRSLRPAAALWSRLVVIKGFMEPEGFLAAAQRQLAALGVQGRAALMARTTDRAVEGRSAAGKEEPIRRTLRIHDKDVVGFALGIEELTAEESIRIQVAGLGGRRRFGCGVFVPAWR
jgi:CRISPR-associated protein Cas6